MRKFIIISLIISLGFYSCKDSEKEKQLIQKEIELSEKEKQIESDIKKLEIKEKRIELTNEVKNNIIHCENEKFIIKVDNLNNGDLRYISWDKPKTVSDEPNLVLYDGKVEQQGTGGGYHYLFKNDEWNYVIENNFMGETLESMGVFLKILKNEERKLYSKMTDLTIKKNYDLKAYSRNDLIGNWWTPHYAVRKVKFQDNGSFLFENGDGKKFKGKFELTDKSVSLNFDNGLDKILEIGGGKDNTSLTLIGGGENFVKEWKE